MSTDEDGADYLLRICERYGVDPCAADGVAHWLGYLGGVGEGAAMIEQAPLPWAGWHLAATRGERAALIPGGSGPTADALAELTRQISLSPDDPAFAGRVVRPWVNGRLRGYLDGAEVAARGRVGADRPLVVGGPELGSTRKIREVASRAGIEVVVSGDPEWRDDGMFATRWQYAPVVVVAPQLVYEVAARVSGRHLVRREGVLVVARGVADDPRLSVTVHKMGATLLEIKPHAYWRVLASELRAALSEE